MQKIYYLKESLIKIFLCLSLLIPSLKVYSWLDGSATEKTLKKVEKVIESSNKTQQELKSLTRTLNKLTTTLIILTSFLILLSIYQAVGDNIKKKLFDAGKRDKVIKKVKKKRNKQ